VRNHKFNQSVYQKYLNNYAEPEAQRVLSAFNSAGLKPFSGLPFCSFALAIYDEPQEQLLSFLDMPPTDQLLSVWVFNAPQDGDPAARERTYASLEYFLKRCGAHDLGDGVYGVQLDTSSDVLNAEGSDLAPKIAQQKHYLMFVDRCSPSRLITRQQGVGLARKIAADIAVAIASTNNEGGTIDPIIFFSDADALLPKDYFKVDLAGHSALALPFEHVADQSVELESALYDFRLRYYAEQLADVFCPYAYHSLGATMVVDMSAYCRVRGVPKKAGGEDFYLLNKLAKLNGVLVPVSPVVSIKGRPSSRVPFGTGPAIIAMQKSDHLISSYRFYHPDSFKVLGKLLRVVDNSAAQNDVQGLELLDDFIRSDEHLFDVLSNLGYERFITHCSTQKILGEKLKRAFHEWFDAFATRRFIHTYCDTVFSDVSLSALDNGLCTLSDALQGRRTRILARWGQC